MELPRTLVVCGAGGMANLLYWQVQEYCPECEMIFLEDESDRQEIDLGGEIRPVQKNWDFTDLRNRSKSTTPDAWRYFTLAVSDPVFKIRFVEKALQAGLKPAPTLIHPNVPIHGPRDIGLGGFFSEGAVVISNSHLGDFITLTNHSSVAHHCWLDDYVTLSTGSHLLGNVTLREGVWLGGGTMVRDRITIAPWVQTGVQSAIVKDIDEPGSVVIGVPARKLRQIDIPHQSRCFSEITGAGEND
jgi:acetyltransferase-like isoleucine patch superfamily enzyme